MQLAKLRTDVQWVVKLEGWAGASRQERGDGHFTYSPTQRLIPNMNSASRLPAICHSDSAPFENDAGELAVAI